MGYDQQVMVFIILRDQVGADDQLHVTPQGVVREIYGEFQSLEVFDRTQGWHY